MFVLREVALGHLKCLEALEMGVEEPTLATRERLRIAQPGHCRVIVLRGGEELVGIWVDTGQGLASSTGFAISLDCLINFVERFVKGSRRVFRGGRLLVVHRFQSLKLYGYELHYYTKISL